MKFAVGVTLYNPESEQLERLYRLTECFDRVLLFDNSDNDVGCYDKPSNEKICLIDGKGNQGLPYAFNWIIQECCDYDFLCTMDQDSIFETADINKMKTNIQSRTDLKKLGVIAPFVDYGYKKYVVSETTEKKKWVITSGSFVNLNILKIENIKYDEAYFIDKFEIDLCQQLIVKGYSILMYHGAILYQSLGEKSGHHHPNHNVLRHYYLFRNRFYFNNKWHHGIVKLFLNTAQTLRHITMIVLYENNKLKKLQILKSAIKDYRHHNMGKKEWTE